MPQPTRILPILITGFLASLPQPANAYITAPVPTLGAAVADSTYVTLVRVEKFDREKGVIVYSKVRDLKGKYPRDKMRHVFDIKNTPAHKGQGDVPVRPDEKDWNYALKWAAEGKTAVVFARKYDPYGDFGHTYIDGLWYATMCPARDWDLWYAIYSDPKLLSQWHAGTTIQLAQGVEVMVAGRTAFVPVLGKGNKEELRAGKATFYTLTAAVEARNFDANRDVLAEPLEPAAVRGLQKTLTTATHRDARARAAGALGLLGGNAKAAVETLAETIRTDASGTVRMAAADALVRIEPEGKAALSAIEAALKDPAMSQRKDVLKALQEVRTKLK